MAITMKAETLEQQYTPDTLTLKSKIIHTLDTGHRKAIARQFAVLNRSLISAETYPTQQLSVVQEVKTENKTVLVQRRMHMLNPLTF
jgi:hypothetical protein